MKYEEFIAEIEKMRGVAAQLFDREKLHDDREFRKWRQEIADLISRVSDQGYSINCQISTRTFAQELLTDTSIRKKDLIKSYNQDLLDTINELDILIAMYSRYGPPSIKNKHSNVTENNIDFLSKVKNHWIVSLLVICSVVSSITWTIEYNLYVVPRDFEITKLTNEITRLKDELTQIKTNAGKIQDISVEKVEYEQKRQFNKSTNKK